MRYVELQCEATSADVSAVDAFPEAKKLVKEGKRRTDERRIY